MSTRGANWWLVTGEAAEEEGETEAGRLGHGWGGVGGGCCKNDPEAHFSVTRASASNLGKETGIMCSEGHTGLRDHPITSTADGLEKQ